MASILSKSLGFLGYAIQYACMAHCAFEYIADFVVCSGPSMEPTIYNEDILLTEHITPRMKRFNKGDIVIAISPSNPKQYICKRIIGLPGDKINTGLMSSEVVPRGHVFLQGDNRGNSLDSRSYGSIPQGLIRSRAIIRVWPLGEISSFLS